MIYGKKYEYTEEEQAFLDEHRWDSEIVIPSYFGAIVDGTFAKWFNLKKVSFENNSNIEYIGKNAFIGCEELEQVLDIPATVKSIDTNAFLNCEKLSVVSFEERVVDLLDIGENAFRNCISLKNIELPEGTRMICNAAFKDSGITNIFIPYTVRDIFDLAFAYTPLEDVEFDPGIQLRHLRDRSFLGCNKLKYIIVPQSVTHIGISAFENCEEMELAILPTHLKSLGYGAFFGCKSLNKLSIPSEIEKVSEYAFSRCVKLQEVVFDKKSKCKSIGQYAFEGCTRLKKFECPKKLKDIGLEAFRSCVNLENIKLNDSLEIIGSRAFEGCKTLKDIVIPNSVKKIGMRAFAYCESLENKTVPSLAVVGKDAFKGCTKLAETAPYSAESADFCTYIKDRYNAKYEYTVDIRESE